MANEFQARILTPRAELFSAQVTEALIPGFDGECGVLAEHEDFVGLLGTGVLKVVSAGDDFWFMVSSGVFELASGTLTVLTEVAESAKDIDIEFAKKRATELEPALTNLNSYNEKSHSERIEYDRARARLEAYRRTHLVN